MERTVISVEEIKRFAKDACCASGIPEEESLIFADVLVETDMRGVTTHGVVRLPEYLERIRRGGMQANAELEIVQDWSWGGVIDAHNGIGHVSAYKGMSWVIEKAKKLGIGMAAMRMSNHFGMAAYYSLMAAEQGMIGLVASNTAPLMAPWGGKEMKIGNNPLSIAVPSEPFAICFDTACSIAARSKLYQAQREGKNIPAGWALDKHGKETTDPAEALEGVLLPLGGHKGYGLAIMIDVLAGILSGGSVSPDVKHRSVYSTPRDIGHFFIAIHIDHFLPLSEFTTRSERYANLLRSTEPAYGFGKVRVPGDAGAENRLRCLETGIRYHASTIQIFNQLAANLDIPALTR